MTNSINMWKLANLTTMGKVLIWNTCIFPIISYSLPFLNLTHNDILQIDKLKWKFLYGNNWTRIRHKIRYKQIVSVKENGGLYLRDTYIYWKASKLFCLINLIKDDWSSPAAILLQNIIIEVVPEAFQKRVKPQKLETLFALKEFIYLWYSIKISKYKYEQFPTKFQSVLVNGEKMNIQDITFKNVYDHLLLENNDTIYQPKQNILANPQPNYWITNVFIKRWPIYLQDFKYRLVNEKLPLYFLQDKSSCPVCDLIMESKNHFCTTCNIAQRLHSWVIRVWNLVFKIQIDISSQNWLTLSSTNNTPFELTTLIDLTNWFLWKHYNDTIFKDSTKQISSLKKSILLQLYYIFYVNKITTSTHLLDHILTLCNL